MDQLLDIVIVNWNSPHLLEQCLQSIQTSSIPLSGKLIMVDNSASESAPILPPPLSIDYIKTDRNLGFGGGCNRGAAHGKAKFILFLNPDILFQQDTVQKLTSFLRSDKLPTDVGILGVQLLNPDGTIQKNVARFPRFTQLFPRMLGLDHILPKIFPPHYDKSMDYSKTQIVQQVPGAFFLVRREVFAQLGGFDERFFMYYEDVDFSFRAYANGWKTLYLADIAVFHQGGGSTQSISDQRLFYSLRSRVLYMRKHGNIAQAVFLTLGILLLEFWARFFKALFQGDFHQIGTTLKAYLLFLTHIKEPFA